MQNACVWSRSLQELYSNCLSGDSLMEVPREQRRCSFEVHLVYCWPFWFNLYHQRALLNYWHLNLFSLGYRHWVNKFLLVFSFILISFFLFFFLFLLCLPRWAHVDQAWDDRTRDQWTSEEAPKATGGRASNQMGCFRSSFTHGLTSIHLVGPRSWSSFSTKTSQTLQTQLHPAYLSLHWLPS